MSARPDAYPFQAQLDYFESIVRGAQKTIVAQIEAALKSGDLSVAYMRQQQLAAIGRTLMELNLTALPLASKLVADAWYQGAERALKQIKALPIDTADAQGTFAGVSTEAVEALQKSLTDRLDSATQTLGRKVQDIYAREQRRSALRAVLGAEGSPSASAKHLAQRLMAKTVHEGQTGFVDRAGRHWSLDTYANMATRTITREAVVQGAMARMASHGIAIARVSTHAGSCEICVPFEGTLVQIGGAPMTEYKGEAVNDTGEAPPFHPNCRHSLMPVSATIDQVIEAEEQGELINA